MRLLDRFIQAAFLALVAASPFAFGSVHPFAYRPLEAALFAIMALWGVKAARTVRVGIGPGGIELPGPRHLALPIAAMAAWIALQLVPLPPAVVGVLSPRTHALYAKVLDGWPQAKPYAGLSARVVRLTTEPPAAVLLPTSEEVAHGAPVPAIGRAASTAAPARADTAVDERLASHLAEHLYGQRWRPLSIAPLLSFSSLLMLLACGGAFLLAAFFPFGEDDGGASRRFVRATIYTVLATGFALAFIGLIEQATWNGRLLWFFVPYDWGEPMAGALQRVCGPFVDPDHFAGYLAMVFPLALACALFPNAVTPSGRTAAAFRVQCCVATFVIFVAVLLSLSRAGWLGLLVGTSVMFVLALPGTSAAEIGPAAAPLRLTGMRLALLGIVGLACAAVMFIGPDARLETAERLNETSSAVGTIAERLTTWRGGLILFRDFPWFGAGLGAWPEIFLRYQVPPWTLLFADEAHNDYLQLAVETGVVGLALGVWIALRVLRAVAAGWRSLDAASLPVAAALVAGVAAIGAIEFFDFDLRVPAVALLMAVMAGVALRFVQNASADDWEDDAPSRAGRALAIAGVAAGAVLTLAALGQNSTVYPYNLHVPRTFAEARAGVVAYPASAYLHQSLAELVGDSDPAARDAELARAVWLDPLNPRIRDRYARALVSEGKPAQALEQIRESLLNCPIFRPENHPYLIPRLILWFPPTLQAAVEQGLAEAVDRGYDPAAGSLAEYYAMFGRYDEEARMYQKVADREDDPMRRATDLTLAGEAYVHAGEIEAALPLFRQAADLVPDDARNYVDMAVMIYGPRRDIPAAERVAQQGIENGADPYALSVAVGDAALGAGMRERAEAAYEQALKYRPDAYDLLTHLGSVYAQDGRTERAILTLNRAAEARPDAAGTYFEIGEMEEGRYRYYEAEQAYRKAVKLAPGNPDYRKRLATFEDRLKTESAAEGGGASR